SAVEAFRPGVVGYAQDLTISGQGWTFDPQSIRMSVTVIHGEADTIVPVAHGQHTAEIIPTASLTICEDHAHLSILNEIPGLAASLAQSSK
ncbi:MAG: alpha/beta fold hydrolase, partial [Microthrixaceae bacterium]